MVRRNEESSTASRACGSPIARYSMSPARSFFGSSPPQPKWVFIYSISAFTLFYDLFQRPYHLLEKSNLVFNAHTQVTLLVPRPIILPVSTTESSVRWRYYIQEGCLPHLYAHRNFRSSVIHNWKMSHIKDSISSSFTLRDIALISSSRFKATLRVA